MASVKCIILVAIRPGSSRTCTKQPSIVPYQTSEPTSGLCNIIIQSSVHSGGTCDVTCGFANLFCFAHDLYRTNRVRETVRYCIGYLRISL